MKEHITLNQLGDQLDFFHRMYDVVRLVDPIHKRVIDYRGSAIKSTNEICYNYWSNGVICDNCISVRAYMENKVFVKLERTEKEILMITAIPLENTTSPVTLELMRDGTSSIFMGSGDYKTGESLHSFVNNLNDMVIKDSLSNLYNRRFLKDRLPVDIIHATINRQPLSLCFIDLDNFKRLNDTYGHEVGDKFIKAVSAVFRKCIRPELDWASRFGGDEFVLCFNNASEEEATNIMEHIRSEIDKIPSLLGIENLHFSISYGIQMMKDTLFTADELIQLADEKMYIDKKRKYDRRLNYKER